MTDDKPQQMVSLNDVMGIIINLMSPPDGYFYAKHTERMIGWVDAATHIAQRVEELANDR